MNDASRLWYVRLISEFERLGMTRSKLDNALFYYHYEGKLIGVATTHVDDVVWAGTKYFEDKVIKVIKQTFKISRENRLHFVYLGLCLEQRNSNIQLHQKEYSDQLKSIEIVNRKNRKPTDEISDIEKAELRSRIGQLNWLSTQTRPDISYDVCQASVNFQKAVLKDLDQINKVVRKVKYDNVMLNFKDIGNLNGCKVICYSDASFRNLNEEGSQGGFIVFIQNKNDEIIPIQWQSKRIKRIVKSTIAAECLSMIEASEAAYLLKLLLEEILAGNCNIDISCVIDNQSLHNAIHSTKCVEDRGLRPDIALLREKLANGEITDVKWVESSQQLADCLTKAGASSKQLLEVLSSGMLQN